MEIVCSPRGVVDIDHPGQGLLDIKGSGFDNVVLHLSLLCDEQAIYNKTQKKQQESKLKVIKNPNKMYVSLGGFLEKCENSGLGYSIAVAPYLDRRTSDSSQNELIRELAEESIRVCGRLDCRYIVIRPLFAGIADDELWNQNKNFYISLAEIARENNIMILLENQCKNINGHLVRGICSDGNEAAKWLDELNRIVGERRFGLCMNVGVCNLCGQNMYDFIRELGNRVHAVIVSDNDGNRENAMLPFTAVNSGRSGTDWLSLFRGLREIDFDGALILDVKDTAEATSPILRAGLLQYAKSVIDYFVWQINIEKNLQKYESRVLFGAGNMCRNYMKCYGEKYPPLFTCDNNSKLWGTEFCGLTVRSPEELKRLKEGTAIFICNVYYREIERQLRDMGLKNPIAFFNDEYMPTFHFDSPEGVGEK